MDRDTAELITDMRQRAWDKADAERRKIADRRYSKGTPKRELHAMFRRARARYDLLRSEGLHNPRDGV